MKEEVQDIKKDSKKPLDKKYLSFEYKNLEKSISKSTTN